MDLTDRMNEILGGWPDCAIPECGYKVCTWGSESLCYPHEEHIVGTEEMLRRFNLTHEHEITSIADQSHKTNYMTKTFKEIE